MESWYSDSLIRRCIIIKNGHHGINLGDGSSQWIDHCVIWGNGAYGVFNGWGAPLITNSIIWSNRDGSLHNCHDGVRFCIVQGHTWADSLDGPVLIPNDPLFLNPDPEEGQPYDFHLQSLAEGIYGVMHDSHAIDMGSPDGSNPDWQTDIGVYQGYVRTEPVVIPRRVALPQGTSKRLYAVGGTAPYTWSSSDPSVVSVDPNGILDAHKPGYAFIHARSADGTDGYPATLVVRYPGDEYLVGMAYPPGPDTNALDAANQYYQDTNDHLGMALTGLARSLNQPDPNITAILDGLGVTYGGLFVLDDPNKSFGPRSCEELPAGAPGLDQIQAVLHGSVLPLMDTTLGHLDMIDDPNYRRYVVDPNDNIIVEVDKTDIDFLKAGFHLAHGVIDIVSSYTLWDPNMDYCDDLDDPFKDANDKRIPDSFNDYLAEHPQLLYLLPDTGSESMLSGLGHFQAAFGLIQKGLDLMDAEEDGQYDDLVSMDMVYNEPEGVDRFREGIGAAIDALDPNTPPGILFTDWPEDDTPCAPIEIDLASFFLNPLEPDLLPDFDSDNRAVLDTIPDPTLNWMLPSMELARFNGILMGSLDVWGWQEPSIAINWIEGEICLDELSDLKELKLYRDTEPCVDPEHSTLIAYYRITPETIPALEFAWDGHCLKLPLTDDINIDYQQEVYYYLAVASVSDPVAEIRSDIFPIYRNPGGCLLYVDAVNTGYADGSPEYPYETINDALFHASPYCTIHIAPGHYHENVNISKNHIRLQGEDPSATTVHGRIEMGWGSDGSILDGLTIADSDDHGLFIWSTNTIIRNCIIRNNNESGIFIPWTYQWNSPRINHCIIWGNGGYGIENFIGFTAILNSIIWANEDIGINDIDYTYINFSIVQGHTWNEDHFPGHVLINNDPLFVDADPKGFPPYDFHLQSRMAGFPHDSSGIDMGTSDWGTRDGHTDIGIYQGEIRTEPIVSPRRKALQKGETGRFHALGGKPPYYWSSSDSVVATVDPNGVVEAVNPGYAFIRARSADGIDGAPATLVVRNSGDEYFVGLAYPPGPDPDAINAAYEYYQSTNDHLGMAVTGLVRSLDQPDPNITAILDGLGVTYGGLFVIDDPNRTSGPRTCEDLPADVPGLDEIQQTLHGGVIPLIDTAIGHLNMIDDPEYRRYVADPNDDSIVEIDMADINLLEAGLHMLHSVVDIVGAYNLWDPNMDYCDDIDDPFLDANHNGIPNAINDYMDEHPELLYLLPDGGAGHMLSALEHMQSAVDLFLEGLDFLEMETDGQFDDLISLDNLEVNRDDLDRVREVTDIVKESLDPDTPPGVFYLDWDDTFKCTPLEVDLSALFLYPPEPDLLPVFDINNHADLDTFPDPTFYGILPGMGIARLNGIIADELDGWGQQIIYNEVCENEIGWHMWVEDLGDFLSLQIYRDTQPCVDPNISTLMVSLDPNNIQGYLQFSDELRMIGYFYDTGIDCSSKSSYYYQIVANYEKPQMVMKSGIIALKNTGYWCDGDVDYNGEITPRDALCAFEKYLGICPTSCGIDCMNVCCDVNEIDACTPADALCIFRRYLGMMSCLDWLDNNQY